MAKLCITLPDEFMGRMGEFAKENGLSRSSLIAAAVADYMRVRQPKRPVGRPRKDVEAAETRVDM